MKASILKGVVPKCSRCGGLIKPDIVFFGENLPSRFFSLKESDSGITDLLVCIGKITYEIRLILTSKKLP